MTFNLQSDQYPPYNTPPFVSVGVRDDYGDSDFAGTTGGNLITTAVLVKSPKNRVGDPTWAYRPTRVAVLFFQQPDQAPNRVCTDFYLTLYADDGTTTHNPSRQLAKPFFIQATTPLLTYRSVWLHTDIQPAGWPIMTADTYYWVAVSPSTPLNMPPYKNKQTRYNGAIWAGFDADTTYRPNTVVPLFPASVRNDPNLFTGRELNSQRFPNDPDFYATTQAAVDFLNTDQAWETVPSAPDRFTNWQLTSSNIRYGIQIIGWQVTPSNSATASREFCEQNAAFKCFCRVP
jgi:hypothetical protein